MPLTPVELERVRDQIGDATPPEDYDLDEIFDREGTWQATALVILNRRLAALLEAPAQFTVPGEYSQSTGPNITALQNRIKALSSSTAAPGATSLPTVATGLPAPPRPR